MLFEVGDTVTGAVRYVVKVWVTRTVESDARAADGVTIAGIGVATIGAAAVVIAYGTDTIDVITDCAGPCEPDPGIVKFAQDTRVPLAKWTTRLRLPTKAAVPGCVEIYKSM